MYLIPVILVKKVYGQETNDDHRPSDTPANPQSEADHQNREMFRSQKVRDVVLCGECSKPRCIYSNKKLTTEQVCTIINY